MLTNKVVAYLVSDVIIVISLSLTSYEFNCYFHIDIKSKTSYPLTSSTHLPTISTSSLSSSIVTPTPDIPGN